MLVCEYMERASSDTFEARVTPAYRAGLEVLVLSGHIFCFHACGVTEVSEWI
jgi:hypothetical protein